MEFNGKEIVIKAATIRIIEEGLLENVIHENTELTPEDLHEIKECNLELSGGNPYAVLVNSGMMTSVNKEARELAASKEFQKVTKAKALLVWSLGHKIIGNFYLKVNKPTTQLKFLQNEIRPSNG